MDYILRATAANGSVRVFVANTRETVQKAYETHGTFPVMSAALGRTLTASAIMGCMLKNDADLLTVTIKGDGPGGGIVVTADSKARVKGYCFEPFVELPLNEKGKLDVRGAMGEGSMTVVKDMGLKEPYVGNIPLVSGEIAEDFTYYFAKSEQVPSAVALGVLVDRDHSIKQSGGFIIQMLPDADEKVVSSLEKKLIDFKPVTTLLEEGLSCEDILEELLGEYNINILDKVIPEFYCNCTRERVEKALISIGGEEIQKILEEEKMANLHCHFCNKDYQFLEDDLKRLLKSV